MKYAATVYSRACLYRGGYDHALIRWQELAQEIELPFVPFLGLHLVMPNDQTDGIEVQGVKWLLSEGRFIVMADSIGLDVEDREHAPERWQELINYCTSMGWEPTGPQRLTLAN